MALDAHQAYLQSLKRLPSFPSSRPHRTNVNKHQQKSANINISKHQKLVNPVENCPERAKSEAKPPRRSAPEEGGPGKLMEMRVLLVQTPWRKSTRNKER